MHYDLVIVGAGISGTVLAERCANILNRKILVIEKRNHIGGNCYDFYNKDGILVPLYGPHFFHTNYNDVWEYVSRFTRWLPYEHRVLSYVDRKFVPVPVNIKTVNMLLKLNIKNNTEMIRWLKNNVEKIKCPKNSEESALARMGKILYEKLFKNYTKKQWDIWPDKLDASIMDRIPIRTNFDDRYFVDKYQGMPMNGYTKIFENMLNNPNITIQLNTDYFKCKKEDYTYDKLIYTGPIDKYFNYKMGTLQYRSLKFKFQTLNKEKFQPVAQVNYPNNYSFTRITEPKHASGQILNKTTIIREYPTWNGDPYYPVSSPKNRKILVKYIQEKNKLEKIGIFFIGRLANYQYLNMDLAFKNALDKFTSIKNKL